MGLVNKGIRKLNKIIKLLRAYFYTIWGAIKRIGRGFRALGLAIAKPFYNWR